MGVLHRRRRGSFSLLGFMLSRQQHPVRVEVKSLVQENKFRKTSQMSKTNQNGCFCSTGSVLKDSRKVMAGNGSFEGEPKENKRRAKRNQK